MEKPNSCLCLQEAHLYYNLALSKWIPSGATQDDCRMFTMPSFEDMLITAGKFAGTSLCGKIIGFFTLKKQMTILVETSHIFDVLLARSLCKQQSVKVRNTVKQIARQKFDVAGGVLEQSISIKSGHICNFIGIQHSLLYLNEGLITNGPPLTGPAAPPLPARPEDKLFLSLASRAASPDLKLAAVPLSDTSSSLAVCHLPESAPHGTPPSQSHMLPPPALAAPHQFNVGPTKDHHGAARLKFRSLFTEFDDNIEAGTSLRRIQYLRQSFAIH